MEVVKEIWAVMERDGSGAGMEAMLARCHPDLELRPYSGEGRTLRGADEVREFWNDRLAEGGSVHVMPFGFEERDGLVFVTGSIRVTRGDGSIADAQVRWSYGFRGEKIARAEFSPLTADISG